jgi:hypothetical protein
LKPDLYPDWDRREDGSISDGGIYAEQACIIPEHNRIWEYPAFYARRVVQLRLGQVMAALPDFENGTDTLYDSILLATEVLWTTFDQVDLRVRFILLMTALETIARGEATGEVPDYLREVTEELRSVVEKRRKVSAPTISKLLEKWDQRIKQMTDPSIMDRLRGLLCRVSGIDADDPTQVAQRDQVYATINKLYGVRSGLAHGGKMRMTDSESVNKLKTSLQTLETLVIDTLLFRWKELDEHGTREATHN